MQCNHSNFENLYILGEIDKILQKLLQWKHKWEGYKILNQITNSFVASNVKNIAFFQDFVAFSEYMNFKWQFV